MIEAPSVARSNSRTPKGVVPVFVRGPEAALIRASPFLYDKRASQHKLCAELIKSLRCVEEPDPNHVGTSAALHRRVEGAMQNFVHGENIAAISQTDCDCRKVIRTAMRRDYPNPLRLLAEEQAKDEWPVVAGKYFVPGP